MRGIGLLQQCLQPAGKRRDQGLHPGTAAQRRQRKLAEPAQPGQRGSLLQQAGQRTGLLGPGQQLGALWPECQVGDAVQGHARGAPALQAAQAADDGSDHLRALPVPRIGRRRGCRLPTGHGLQQRRPARCHGCVPYGLRKVRSKLIRCCVDQQCQQAGFQQVKL
ncbi:hypothetical protein B8X02_06260 [Stenotrophomonas rhizophila]|nr:hypothetical protein B8X02_06260 [Stenotrophomonas rhizophila]